MKIVIANSIGIDKDGYYIIHSPSRWSEGLRNKYQWFAYYPWELAYLSSLLKKETKHQIKFLDGCLERLNFKKYYRRVFDEKPDFLIIESATRMIEENVSLALKIKNTLGTKIIFVGQHASAFPEQLLERGVDYVCIGEYEYTVLELLKGTAKDKILGLYPNCRRPLLDINSLPWPEDNDVSRLSYGYPGEPSSEYLEIQMYASRGCLMSCNFCVARHIYYAQPNWRSRNIDNIIKEINYLVQKYPQMEGIFFDEEVHNGEKDFIINLCQAICSAGLNRLHHEAMCDIRFLDADVLKTMKEAGYYKIRVGIETASNRVMEGINKFIEMDSFPQHLRQAKSLGIKTYGTFILGALGSDKEEDSKTIALIKDLILNNLLDNLQISICTPQPGTPFYQIAKDKNYLLTDLKFNRYDGGNFAIVNYPKYSSQMIEKIKKQAFLAREHCFLKQKIKNNSLRAWIKSIYKRYGLLGLMSRAARRLFTDLQYQIIRWSK